MTSFPKPSGRAALLRARQRREMACSSERYVRGSTRQFYDAPSWLWTSVVELLARHERAYLHHCWRYAVGKD